MCENAVGKKDDFLSPGTPPSRNIGDEDVSAGIKIGEFEAGLDGLERLEANNGEDGVNISAGKAKRRHRRAKGRKRKHKWSLMITNEDGTDFSSSGAGGGPHQTPAQPPVKQTKLITLRPTNPLLNAPRNSTQFIIDDHENSNLFWNFEAQPAPIDQQQRGLVLAGAGGGSGRPGMDSERYSPDDESFWTQYSERDFEDVYETAHQEEILGWEKERIVREIATMERRQKQLIELLAAVDPIVYLEKLQGELLSLQEVNRQLKLVNIAEKLHRQERLERGEQDDSSDSDSRLPDSTSQEAERPGLRPNAKQDDNNDDDEDDKGGCASGCCLAEPCEDAACLEQQMLDQQMLDDQDEDGEEDGRQLQIEQQDKDSQKENMVKDEKDRQQGDRQHELKDNEQKANQLNDDLENKKTAIDDCCSKDPIVDQATTGNTSIGQDLHKPSVNRKEESPSDTSEEKSSTEAKSEVSVEQKLLGMEDKKSSPNAEINNPLSTARRTVDIIEPAKQRCDVKTASECTSDDSDNCDKISLEKHDDCVIDTEEAGRDEKVTPASLIPDDTSFVTDKQNI